MIKKTEWQEAVKEKLLLADIRKIEADFELADAENADRIVWLGMEDSNLPSRIQSPLSYR